jgi:hypothetical protein
MVAMVIAAVIFVIVLAYSNASLAVFGVLPRWIAFAGPSVISRIYRGLTWLFLACDILVFAPIGSDWFRPEQEVV